MKNIIYITILVVSGIFTSCTDSSEEAVDLIEQETMLTGGEDSQDPDEDPDPAVH